MSETYSAMVERIMRDNFAKFALEYERKMYEPPDFLRHIQEEERHKMSSELTADDKHRMVVKSLDSLSAKIETLEKTNYADRVQGRFINGEFDGIRKRIEALENKHNHVMQSISDEINARLKIEERIEALENPSRKEAEDAAQRLWERAIEDKLAGMHHSISQMWEKVHSKDVKPDAPESVADAISRAADKHLELSGYPPEPKRPKYEYDIIRYNSRPSDEEILEKLNDFGFSGWELVLVKDWTYFIRREIIP